MGGFIQFYIPLLQITQSENMPYLFLPLLIPIQMINWDVMASRRHHETGAE